MNSQEVKKYTIEVLKQGFPNKKTLDKLSTSDSGNLLFDGKEIKGSGSDAIIIDDKLDLKSENPVSNKVITAQLNEVFQSVSEGKSLVASAITDKGVATASDATFQTMATNINNISGASSEVVHETYANTKYPETISVDILSSNNGKRLKQLMVIDQLTRRKTSGDQTSSTTKLLKNEEVQDHLTETISVTSSFTVTGATSSTAYTYKSCRCTVLNIDESIPLNTTIATLTLTSNHVKTSSSSSTYYPLYSNAEVYKVYE